MRTSTRERNVRRLPLEQKTYMIEYYRALWFKCAICGKRPRGQFYYFLSKILSVLNPCLFVKIAIMERL